MGFAGKGAFGRESLSGAARACACLARLLLVRACAGLALLLLVRADAAAMAAASDARASQPGVVMRVALEAQAQGELERAAQLLAELRAREPLIADYADLLRLRMWVAAERWEDAVALGRSWDHPASPVEAEFRELFGRALAARGDEGAARSQWIAALARTEDGERLAALRLEIARSELRTGNERGAAETFLEIFTRHPLTAADAEASAALDAVDRRLGPLRQAKQLRRRGDTLFAQRRNDEALAVYDAALAQGGGSEKDAAKIRQKRAHTLFRLRRYPEAVQAFSSYPAGTSDRIEQARAVARAGDVPGAVRDLERIAAGARGSHASQARLLAALLLDGEGQAEQARQHYLELVRNAPRSTAGLTAIWQLGWEAYRAGNHRSAIGYFDKLAPLEPDEMSRLRARTWRARARETLGETELAQ
jgi:tetratricopeptide (TPR) repeat protein